MVRINKEIAYSYIEMLWYMDIDIIIN